MKIHLIFLSIAIFMSLPVQAVPVKNLVLDVDETLVQRDQEFTLRDNKLVPLLEEINISFPKADNTTESRIYYLRPGVREFLTYASKEVEQGKLQLSLLSKKSQVRVNEILKTIKIDNHPLMEYVHYGFGREILRAYSLIAHPGRNSRYKNLSLIFHPKGQVYWERLKQGDVSFVDSLTINKMKIPNDTVLIDDSPEMTIENQRDHVVKIKYSGTKSPEFWQQYKEYVSEEYPPLNQLKKREDFLADIDVERNQFKILQWLLEDAKRNPLPNVYADWTKMLDAPKVLVTEKTHYKYLIADLLKNDSSDTDVVILGRDGDLFFETLDEVKGVLEVKSNIHYLSLSRILTEKSERIIQVLQSIGIDPKKVISGERKLRIVDTGFAGTVPRRVARAIFANDPKWKTDIANFSAFLFTTQLPGGLSPKNFSKLEDYLAAAGPLERTPHQYRFGKDDLREVVLHWERRRPKKNNRAYRVDANGKIALEPSHPTENRFARLLDFVIHDYFAQPSHVEPIKERIEFLRNPGSGSFPPYWSAEEPNLQNIPEVGPTQVIAKNVKHDFFAWGGKIPYRLLSRLKDNKTARVFLERLSKVGREAVDPRERGANQYDNDLSPNWVGYLEDPHNVLNSRYNYEPQYGLDAVMSRKSSDQKPFSISRLKAIRSIADKNQAATELLINSISEKISSQVTLEELMLDIAKAHFKKGADNTLFRIKAQKGVDDPEAIENNWHWFVNWLFREIKDTSAGYDPFLLAAKVHYILAGHMAPFGADNEEVSRDIIDYLFIHAGQSPPQWNKENPTKARDWASPQDNIALLVEVSRASGPLDKKLKEIRKTVKAELQWCMRQLSL